MTTKVEARGAGTFAGLVMGTLLLGAGCMIEANPTTATTDAERAQSATVGQPNAEPAPTEAIPDHIWPPRLGERYPNLRLRTPSGERIELASLEGRVILVEPIGMDCPACNAFAGGNRPGMGGFQGVQPQGGMPSIDEMLDQYAGGLTLDDDASYSSTFSSTGRAAMARRNSKPPGSGQNTLGSKKARTSSCSSVSPI